MKKPFDSKIKRMSTTAKGAKKAALLKWDWICQASQRELQQGRYWPKCGLCMFYIFCRDCPINSCNCYRDYFENVMDAWYDLVGGKTTLAQFRIAARKMRDRIKEI